jgi:hypothetical protein
VAAFAGMQLTWARYPRFVVHLLTRSDSWLLLCATYQELSLLVRCLNALGHTLGEECMMVSVRSHMLGAIYANDTRLR